jgi:hypothetical protein
LCAAIGFAHLPAQAGQDLCKSLAEAAIGAGHQRGTEPYADVDGWNRNRNWLHELLLTAERLFVNKT